MHKHISTRAANVMLAAAALAVGSSAYAQQAGTTPQPVEAASPDPSFSAYSLSQLCQQKTDDVAQGQCVGAIRGIIHGYQYGVLFLGQRATVPSDSIRRVSLCLTGTPVSAIVDEFVSDTREVGDDALRRTPAEVAVLGSVHMHHACN